LTAGLPLDSTTSAFSKGAGAILGLPLFFEVGLVMMVPIIFVMARRSNQPIVRTAIPALAGVTTSAGIVAPVVTGLSAMHNSLLALSIGAGSVCFCHVNDAGFWMVREYFGLALKQTVFVWSILQTIVSVVGPALTLVLWGVLI